ncbi:hypothetical protein C943_01804 [Mariniradius saccharolyticus AK6]|uniref:DUF4262 domain-containing protein n=1 Tax=Mariniradius saccharolyticus AK6 TaxID=1239962 RepID=M7X2Z4_9BACT|nr:DUF4262 domain-containing protein [Mariniradius saccharolyticus]EMS31845.1 hypothetical protein C943_01804 [Mariniradius saccharolyticus AK6]
MINREQFLKTIKSNINRNQYHVTLIAGDGIPRFAYTIGLKDQVNVELIFAGGEYFSANEINELFHRIGSFLETNPNGVEIDIPLLGSFSLVKVHPSWSKLLMLGVYDYFQVSEFNALQILPDAEHHTLDVPDLSKEFDTKAEPVWKWLIDEWNYSVPRDSKVVTNLAALKGEKITEIMRWEKSEWEMFAGPGPDVPKEQMRIVSLGTLLGIDQTLVPSMNLKIGKGLWRDHVDLIWNDWG